jgi:hypothetical protein
VLELQPVREQHPADKLAGRDGEVALVEGHERHLVPRRRARHGLVGRNDPLDGLVEGRQLARLNKTKELLARDIGARPVRHHDGEVLGELQMQAAVALWMRKNSELKGQAQEREKKQMKSKVPNQRSTRGFKGDRPDSPPPAPGLLCQQDFRPRAWIRAPFDSKIILLNNGKTATLEVELTIC